MSHNPAAFPVNSANLGQGGAYAPEPGMTLRDWFAGQAIGAAVELVGREPRLANLGNENLAGFAADIAFTVADAMLAARRVVEAAHTLTDEEN